MRLRDARRAGRDGTPCAPRSSSFPPPRRRTRACCAIRRDAAQRGDSRGPHRHLRRIAEQIDAQPGPAALPAADAAAHWPRALRPQASWTPPSAPSRSTATAVAARARPRNCWPSSTSAEANGRRHCRAGGTVARPPTDARPSGLLSQAKLSAGQPQQAATLMRGLWPARTARVPGRAGPEPAAHGPIG